MDQIIAAVGKAVAADKKVASANTSTLQSGQSRAWTTSGQPD